MNGFSDIRPGDQVTIRVAGGSTMTGRAVSYSTLHESWTVVMDNGVTMIALCGNFVSARKELKDA